MKEPTTPEQIQDHIRFWEASLAEYERIGDAYMADWARERVKFYRELLAEIGREM